MERQLYPLKFTPIVKSKIWGGDKLKQVLNKKSSEDNLGESWEISGVEGDVSVVSNGFLKGNTLEELIDTYLGELVGDKVYEQFGSEFPLLFKFIDANDNLSIQVHPNDEVAKERHNAYGKTEMWYVIDAEPGSKLISGFATDTNKQEYLKALEEGTLLELLKSYEVASGDTFFIPAGNVHAIGAGILLAEIQQTSDITYRIYDFDRKDKDGNTRELHTDLALDVNNYSLSDTKVKYTEEVNNVNELASCKYFTTNVLNINKPYLRDVYLLNSFVAYMCIEGSASIKYADGEETILKGESVLIPASLGEIEITPNDNARFLEVYIK